MHLGLRADKAIPPPSPCKYNQNIVWIRFRVDMFVVGQSSHALRQTLEIHSRRVRCDASLREGKHAVLALVTLTVPV